MGIARACWSSCLHMSSQPSHGAATAKPKPETGNGAELDHVRISPFPMGSQTQLSPVVTPFGWVQKEQTCLPGCLEQCLERMLRTSRCFHPRDLTECQGRWDFKAPEGCRGSCQLLISWNINARSIASALRVQQSAGLWELSPHAHQLPMDRQFFPLFPLLFWYCCCPTPPTHLLSLSLVICTLLPSLGLSSALCEPGIAIPGCSRVPGIN